MSKFLYFITVVLLIILAVVFYWYGYRPSAIKESCAQAVKVDISASKYDLDKAFGYLDKPNKEIYYSNCLHLKGL